MTRRARAGALTIVAIVLLAASLRVAVASLSPVITQITEDFAVPSTVVGLIGSAPPVAFAVFGILTPMLARRVELETLATFAVALSAAGLVARAFSADAIMLLVTTLIAFAGIGVGNVIMPALIKKHFPESIGRMTTVYLATVSVATLVPPLVAVPIADTAGWRVSLGAWAAVGVVAIVPWVALAVRGRRERGDDPIEEADAAVLGRLLRLPVTWALVAAFLVTSGTVYAMFAWMPTLMQQRAGVDAATAGAMLGVFGGMGLPFALAVPVLVERFRAIRTLFAAAVLPGLAGVAGLLFAPTAAPWVWMLLLSLPSSLFPLVLVLFGLRTRTHTTTVALSGAVQSIGYALAALMPIGVGALHDATEGWEAPLWLMAGVILIGVPAGLVVARPGFVEDAWERRGR